MVEKIKFRIVNDPEWRKGRQFMKELAEELATSIKFHDATEVITTTGVEIFLHPDVRGFSFITCKVQDLAFKPLIQKYRSKYTDTEQ